MLIRYWMALSLCSLAIETTFPLSNFKTKHIFGILMARVKFWVVKMAVKTIWGIVGAPIFFLSFFTVTEGCRFASGCQGHPKGGAVGAAPPEI